MHRAEFVDITRGAFDTYYARLELAFRHSQLETTADDPVLSVPQTLVVTEAPGYLVAELIGARRQARPLRVARRRVKDLDDALGQFRYPPDATPLLSLGGGLINLALITSPARDLLRKRFPGLAELFPSTLVFAGPEAGPPVRVGPDVAMTHLDNVVVVDEQNGSVRAKHIRFMCVVRADVAGCEYRPYVDSLLPWKDGARPVGEPVVSAGHAEFVTRAGQFANTYLMSKLRETSIGEFIDNHRDILLDALGAQDLVTEPEIPWQVPSPDPDEQAINPDLFVKSAEGRWDVFDLKLALLDKLKITRGQWRRRRFVASIEEGIAQLAHYRDVLSIPEDVRYVEERYGVLLEEPRFVLVAGNEENSDPIEIAEAKRRLGDFELLNYDTILQLYLFRHGVMPDSDEDAASLRS